MSDELVPKCCHYRNPHLGIVKQTKRLDLLWKKGGWRETVD